jgi:hypothetical protein
MAESWRIGMPQMMDEILGMNFMMPIKKRCRSDMSTTNSIMNLQKLLN